MRDIIITNPKIISDTVKYIEQGFNTNIVLEEIDSKLKKYFIREIRKKIGAEITSSGKMPSCKKIIESKVRSYHASVVVAKYLKVIGGGIESQLKPNCDDVHVAYSFYQDDIKRSHLKDTEMLNINEAWVLCKGLHHSDISVVGCHDCGSLFVLMKNWHERSCVVCFMNNKFGQKGKRKTSGLSPVVHN
ncbi:FlhC family transcriptional regulator [Kistimonas scapharcae]